MQGKGGGLGLGLEVRLSPAELEVTSSSVSKASSSASVKPSDPSERAGEEVMGFSNRLESVSALAHASRISSRVGAMRASFDAASVLFALQARC